MPDSAVRRLLDEVCFGRLDPADAVPALRAALGLCDDRAVREAEGVDLTLRRLAGVEDDRDGAGTWTEIEAARVTGRLSEQQYAALRAGLFDAER